VGERVYVPPANRLNGRYDYIGSPYYGDPNGIYIGFEPSKKWELTAGVSYNSYSDKNVTGLNSSQGFYTASAAYIQKKYSIGTVLYSGFLKGDRKVDQYGISFFQQFEVLESKIKSEIAVMDNGAFGANLIFGSPSKNGTSFVGKLWGYHNRFQAFYSDGACNQESYIDYEPDSLGFEARSEQMGEFGSNGTLTLPIYKDFSGSVRFEYYKCEIDSKNGAENYLGIKYDGGNSDFNLYATRNWLGYGATGDTKDKITFSGKASIIPTLEFRHTSYFKMVQYKTGVYAKGFKLSEGLWFEPKKSVLLGAEVERIDTKLGDESLSGAYWNISFTPEIDFKVTSFQTELLFKKYDVDEGWTPTFRINALVAW
jgi:hypothetical protein